MVEPKTKHCRNGHERTAKTIYIAPKTGIVDCRICRLNRTRALRASDSKVTIRERDSLLFGNNREIAILRDGEKCVSCRMTREEHRRKYNRDITVDHIDGRGRYTPKSQKNNDLSNLQTLCLKCHGRKDGLRQKEKWNE